MTKTAIKKLIGGFLFLRLGGPVLDTMNVGYNIFVLVEAIAHGYASL